MYLPFLKELCCYMKEDKGFYSSATTDVNEHLAVTEYDRCGTSGTGPGRGCHCVRDH